MTNNKTNTADIIAELRRDVDICKNALAAAEKAVVQAETSKSIAEKNLREMGVDPKDAAAEIERLDAEIAAKIAAVKGSIPYDTLRELGRYPA